MVANLRFNPVVNTKLPAILSHRRSTTVSLETYPFILLHYDCLNLPQRSKSPKVKQRSARTVETRKRGWRGLYIFVKTLFPLNFLGILQGQRAITYHENLISKSCKSRVTSLKNRKSHIIKDGFIEFLNYISISLAIVEPDGGIVGYMSEKIS